MSDLAPLVVDIQECARLLKTSPKTIRRALRARTFPIPRVHGIDKKYRWAYTEVQAFVERGGVVPGMRAVKKRA